jgi:hypothetical protein
LPEAPEVAEHRIEAEHARAEHDTGETRAVS